MYCYFLIKIILKFQKLPDEVLQEIENAEANELKISCDILKSCKRVMDFIKSCIRLCWYMNIQEPPVYMVTDVDPNLLHMFRAYTRSGDVIDYVVWPSYKLLIQVHLIITSRSRFGNYTESRSILKYIDNFLFTGKP